MPLRNGGAVDLQDTGRQGAWSMAGEPRGSSVYASLDSPLSTADWRIRCAAARGRGRVDGRNAPAIGAVGDARCDTEPSSAGCRVHVGLDLAMGHLTRAPGRECDPHRRRPMVVDSRGTLRGALS